MQPHIVARQILTPTDVCIVAFIHSARDFAELDSPKRVEWLIHGFAAASRQAAVS